jgi:acyl-CoA dehydrogenase
LDFDFPDELKQLRDTARAFLTEHAPTAVVRKVLDGDLGFDRELWAEMGAMGWLAATIPETHGGLDLGPLAVCVMAEEIGRSLAPVPFSSSVTLATEALRRYGSPEQKRTFLPRLADGSAIGSFAMVETLGTTDHGAVATRFADGRLDGTKMLVADGGVADFAIVAARSEDAEVGLYIAPLQGTTITRTPRQTIDPSRGHADLSFNGHEAEPLPGAQGVAVVSRLLDSAAVAMAFEQIGVASAALDMATAYAKERYAFGRPVGSFQAIKHKLVDVYVAVELARSNAYFAAWALSHDAPELPVAAAAARVSACDAAWLATKENIQTHGGMGFTWDVDCHLYYRRAKLLGLALGSATEWKRKLIARLCLHEGVSGTDPGDMASTPVD